MEEIVISGENKSLALALYRTGQLQFNIPIDWIQEIKFLGELIDKSLTGMGRHLRNYCLSLIDPDSPNPNEITIYPNHFFSYLPKAGGACYARFRKALAELQTKVQPFTLIDEQGNKFYSSVKWVDNYYGEEMVGNEYSTYKVFLNPILVKNYLHKDRMMIEVTDDPTLYKGAYAPALYELCFSYFETGTLSFVKATEDFAAYMDGMKYLLDSGYGKFYEKVLKNAIEMINENPTFFTIEVIPEKKGRKYSFISVIITPTETGKEVLKAHGKYFLLEEDIDDEPEKKVKLEEVKIKVPGTTIREFEEKKAPACLEEATTRGTPRKKAADKQDKSILEERRKKAKDFLRRIISLTIDPLLRGPWMEEMEKKYAPYLEDFYDATARLLTHEKDRFLISGANPTPRTTELQEVMVNRLTYYAVCEVLTRYDLALPSMQNANIKKNRENYLLKSILSEICKINGETTKELRLFDASMTSSEMAEKYRRLTEHIKPLCMPYWISVAKDEHGNNITNICHSVYDSQYYKRPENEE